MLKVDKNISIYPTDRYKKLKNFCERMASKHIYRMNVTTMVHPIYTIIASSSLGTQRLDGIGE